ncbi:MAG: type III pantothenate kinase [Candidatus Omnitrophica bacterium]|nr:type III pantothenate kinase [Candidatus Omnitrophota bacterium]
MLILVDVGNTSITFGLSRKKIINKIWDIPTQIIENPASFLRNLSAKIGKANFSKKKIQAVVICTVVPKHTKELKRQFKKIFPNAEICVLGQDIKVTIKNCYRYPREVGMDRLANAVSVYYEYKKTALVIDAGTAITIDVVSQDGEYLGGVIVPGIMMSLNALHEKTALLPLLEIARPQSILGCDTKNAILSGIFYGYTFLINGFIKFFKQKYGKDIIVIGTGGFLSILKQITSEIDIFDRKLTLKGINTAYKIAKK